MENGRNRMSQGDLNVLLGGGGRLAATRLAAAGPAGRLPVTPEMLLTEPSGHLFGLTQNAGMGWDPAETGRPPYLILSTQGGLREADGRPVALGYHTGHWEIGLLVREAAEALRAQGVVPFAAYCSDPCDGRTQGTVGMFDSLPYRNDAAVTLRRLIRSLPGRAGVMGIATCDKGLPAMMLALAGCGHLPGIIVPGGVTLPATGAEDAGRVQTIGARFAHGLISADEAAELGCRACGSPGGGCQFLGTAATAQVVAEALGIALPHSALSPSGEAVWLDTARQSAHALVRLAARGTALSAILTPRAIENAMLLHAAFGGSTNLLLHVPAIAHAAGLRPPTVEDWERVNRATPRLVDALPNGPLDHPTVQVFMAGGVPEVMLHLRGMGLLNLDVLTVAGATLGEVLDWWESSERRQQARDRLRAADGVDPGRVIMGPDAARRAGLARTMIFPAGNIAPEGSVVKATAIDPSVVGRRRRVPASRPGARVHIGSGCDCRHQGAGAGRAGRCAWRRHCARRGRTARHGDGGDLPADVGPEVHPVGQARRDCNRRPLLGGVDGRVRRARRARGAGGRAHREDRGRRCDRDRDRPPAGDRASQSGRPRGSRSRTRRSGSLLGRRRPHPGLRAHPELPADTRLWAALQHASGGTWAGCVYDVERIVAVIDAGLEALSEKPAAESSRFEASTSPRP